jgi:Mg-chelatase subunit ChlD
MQFEQKADCVREDCFLTGIDLNDIRKAVSEGGDPGVFAGLFRQSLGAPCIQVNLAIDRPTALPDPWSEVKELDPNLASFIKNSGVKSMTAPFSDDGCLLLAALPPWGQTTGRYLEYLYALFTPGLIALDTRPFKLGASMLYTISPACATGLPLQAEITYAKSGQFYDGEFFLPGNLNETALVLGWRDRIPVVPVAHPGRPLQPEIYSQHGYLYDAYFWARWQSALNSAWKELDIALEHNPAPDELEQKAESAGLNLMQGIGDEIDVSLRNSLQRESYYIASRLLDLVSFTGNRPHRKRILALLDIAHYTDVKAITQLFLCGKSLEQFVPFEESEADGMLVTGRKRTQPDKEDRANIPVDSLAQRIFRHSFATYIEALNREKLNEPSIFAIIAEIAARLRGHPDVARGVSVRGTIAFEEVLRGFAAVKGGLTREAVLKAACVTLPPRIALKLKGDETALIRNTTKEALYGFRYSPAGFSPASTDGPGQLSTDEILAGLDRLGPLPAREKKAAEGGKLPAVLAENESNKADLKYLESLDLIKKDRHGRYSFTKKALDRMLSELERRFNAGEISQPEYEKQKAQLAALAKNLAEQQYQLSDQERATTVMEMLDAQDKGWNSGVNFNLMHLYYHVKQTTEGAELSQQKRDYYALGRLIDDFARQQMLKKTSDKDKSFVLTGIALDMLFKYLMNGKNQKMGLQGLKAEGKDLSSERQQETRRFSAGDAFRDISIRHTLKTLAKQKRSLAEIRNHDLRVYLKQARRPQSDIAICIDTSGSMGFHHELIYARLVSAGLVQAAIRNRDRVGLVAFNDYGQISLPLTEKFSEPLIDCIAGLSIRGNTNIGDGLKCAADILFRDRSENAKYIILVTDGQPTALSERVFSRLKSLKDRDLTEESALLEARQAAARGAVISVVHIAGPGQDTTAFIRNIARIGRGTVRRLSSAEDLRVVLR